MMCSNVVFANRFFDVSKKSHALTYPLPPLHALTYQDYIAFSQNQLDSNIEKTPTIIND